MACSTTKSTNVALPVVQSSTPAPRIRASRSSWKRFTVLLVIQTLIIVHVVLWIATGRSRTLAPVEPSESIRTVTDGIITVGAIFFAMALLSTALLGRWFCGWGCHVVLLQDACLKFCKRFGLHPKPFRSRLLAFIPLLLGLYMFVWPLAYRFAVVPAVQLMDRTIGAEHALPSGTRSAFMFFGIPVPRGELPPMRGELELTTEDFWATFPGWAIGVPFLVICGFATVYVLGAKGYCTYGCPYGGMFAPLDALAIGRIRVNDNCEHCGHCTAVCTSNVRVHEEVREYGMVVDPGCMKCLDCVSVCPNDALSFGLGKPALRKGKPRGDGVRPNWDLTWPQEIALFVLYWLIFVGVRGVYGSGLVSLLFASGIAAVATFVLWHAYRVLTETNVSFHRWRLKRQGTIRRPGMVYLTVAGVIGLFCAQCIAVRSMNIIGGKYDDDVRIPRHLIFTPRPQTLPRDEKIAARRALDWYDRAASLRDGGIGLVSNAQVDVRRGWLHACLHEFDRAETYIRRALSKARGPVDGIARDAMLLIVLQAPKNDPAAQRATFDRAFDFARETLAEEPDLPLLREQFVALLRQARAFDPAYLTEAFKVAADGTRAMPENTLMWTMRGQLEANHNALEAAIVSFRRALELEPDAPYTRVMLAQSLAANGNLDEANVEIERAIRIAPSPEARYAAAMDFARILMNLGQTDAAERWTTRAATFMPVTDPPG